MEPTITTLVCSSSFVGVPVCATQVATAAEEYGYHMGLAFQIIDDILDIVGAADVSKKNEELGQRETKLDTSVE